MGGTDCPRLQLKLMVAWPLLMVRLREALPCRAQTNKNLFTEAMKNCEFGLDDISEDIGRIQTTTKNGQLHQVLPCGLKSSCHHQIPGAYHIN